MRTKRRKPKCGMYATLRKRLRELDRDTACVLCKDSWRKLHHMPMKRYRTWERSYEKKGWKKCE